MSSVPAYFEFDLTGVGDRYTIDLGGGGGYPASGRSGRPESVPRTLTVKLTSYRLRVGAYGSTFYSPRLLINVRGCSSGYAGGVMTEGGGYGLSSGFSSVIMLTSRTSDTATQNTDSESAGWTVTVPLRQSGNNVEIPSSLDIMLAVGGVEKELLEPPAVVSSSSQALRAIARDVLVSGSRSASQIDGLEVLVDFPFDPTSNMVGYFGLPAMYLLGTGADGTGFPDVTGGVGVIGFTGDAATSWVAEAHQRGAAYALFYSTNGDVVERIDYVVGESVVPDEGDLPTELKAPFSGFITFRSILVLPRLDPLGVPTAPSPFPLYPSTRRSILVPLITHASATQMAGVVELSYGG